MKMVDFAQGTNELINFNRPHLDANIHRNGFPDVFV
jgi:hypothetical protein